MKKYFFYLFFVIFSTSLIGLSQQKEKINQFDENVSNANKNAMKGIYWALENIPVKKDNLTKDLITEDKNICTVKITKEFGGIKIISTGYFNSTIVEITTYKSLSDEKIKN